VLRMTLRESATLPAVGGPTCEGVRGEMTIADGQTTAMLRL